MPATKKKTKTKPSKKSKPRLTARNADILELYQLSVQEPEADVEFLHKAFKKERGRKPILLREDFCGTAWLCAEWVRSDPDRMAIGLDLDQPTLDWGTKRNLAPLGDDARRVKLLKRNVLDGADEKVDVTVAFNFSYWIFKERAELVRYFSGVRKGLRPDGAFALDIHGGPDAQCEVEEAERKKGFTYVWEQKPMDAVTGHAIRHIHFKFKDGSKIRKAFTYDWRVWSLTEVKDILLDAGFHHVDVHWEGATKDGEGNGIFRKKAHAENEECWIAYLMAWANP